MSFETQFKDCIRERAEMTKADYKRQTGRTAGVIFEDLLLEHGRFFPPNPCPKGIRRGTPKQCFHNAWRVVMYETRYRYAEGYVVTPELSSRPGGTNADAP